MVRIIATDDWWQKYVESSMEVRGFFEEIEARGEARGRAEGEARGQAKVRAELKSTALKTVEIAAPELLAELSRLEDAKEILERLGEYLLLQKD